MWEVTTTKITTEDGRIYNSFGIAKGSTVINDISLNLLKISDFISRLNVLEVSEIHAYEVIEDFFGM